MAPERGPEWPRREAQERPKRDPGDAVGRPGLRGKDKRRQGDKTRKERKTADKTSGWTREQADKTDK